MFKINRRALLGLAPVLATVAFAVVPSGASALVQCRVLILAKAAHHGVECNNPPGVVEPQNLRENSDGAGTNPVSTNFPTEGFAVNTKGKLRYKYKVGGLPEEFSTPQGYLLFGVKLQSNPESSATACRAATGTIPWVDIQHSSPSAVFDGGNAWTFSVESNSTACGAEAGKVTIRNVSLLFETLGIENGPVVAAGSIVGVYEQPGANCPAGGIKLNKAQSGITTEPTTTTFEVDNGEATPGNAYICFVAANNYLYPSSAPTWALTQGTGIWKD